MVSHCIVPIAKDRATQSFYGPHSISHSAGDTEPTYASGSPDSPLVNVAEALTYHPRIAKRPALQPSFNITSKHLNVVKVFQPHTARDDDSHHTTARMPADLLQYSSPSLILKSLTPSIVLIR